MRVVNKKAYFDYQILEEYEAGIALTGAETKAARAGRVDLTQSHAKIVGNEAVIINLVILGNNVIDQDRTRKLLLHRKEIVSIQTKIKTRKLTFVPIKIYTKGRLIKLKLGLAKAKKKFEKRQILKERDIKRDIRKQIWGRH